MNRRSVLGWLAAMFGSATVGKGDPGGHAVQPGDTNMVRCVSSDQAGALAWIGVTMHAVGQLLPGEVVNHSLRRLKDGGLEFIVWRSDVLGKDAEGHQPTPLE